MTETILSALSDLFKKYPKVARAVLFGSRARGDFSEKSDYDVAVYGNLSSEEKALLRYYCAEELPTLHKIDLVFMNDNPERKLIENIEKEGIEFYGKA